MKRSLNTRRDAALRGKKPSPRLLDVNDPVYDAYIAAGDHLERFIPSTQNLDNPPVEKPRWVTLANGKQERYTGP